MRSETAVSPSGLSGIEAAKTAKLAQINNAAQKAFDLLKASYPEGEVLSWYKQEAEARAVIAGETTATPFLSALAGERGLSLDELAARVIAKTDAYAERSGSIAGQRQRLEDLLGACATADEVKALEVSISPGEGMPCITG